MAWLDLREEIEEEMAELSGYLVLRNARPEKGSIVRAFRPQRGAWYDEQLFRKRAIRRSTRTQRAAARPPCPRCGAKVERCGPTAKIPTYCSDRCMRAARFARWHAKHGQERNDRRRKAA